MFCFLTFFHLIPSLQQQQFKECEFYSGKLDLSRFVSIIHISLRLVTHPRLFESAEHRGVKMIQSFTCSRLDILLLMSFIRSFTDCKTLYAVICTHRVSLLLCLGDEENCRHFDSRHLITKQAY